MSYSGVYNIPIYHYHCIQVESFDKNDTSHHLSDLSLIVLHQNQRNVSLISHRVIPLGFPFFPPQILKSGENQGEIEKGIFPQVQLSK